MSITKKDFPILEYDSKQKAILMPNRKNLYSFPKKAVFPFLNNEIYQYSKENNCEQIGEFVTITKVFPIYKTIHNGIDLCLCQAPLGSSAAVQFLDFLISYGVKEIITIGCCGSLIDIPENEFLIPTEALRDEGTSYHYLPPSRTVSLNQTAVNSIKSVLNKKGISYQLCKTWTTDGFYRETIDMVNYRKEEGCTVVEMECAGLAACAEFRNAIFGQILYTADTLANFDIHDDRGWGKDSDAIALELALDAVCAI
ncbi:MAG: phosphorylase [Clostridiales bacterium GWF2_38_85]|nr:MAG: phosphorylase [Clostridiales bacterium GWF2_38_85]HBL83964.1 phosphorylase [Clostridiales bacterium]